MKDEDKIKLLENKKQSIQFKVNNGVAAVVGLVVGMAAIFVQVQLTFNNPIISWIVAGVYLFLLYCSGMVDAAIRLRKQIEILEEIDDMIYKIVTREDATEGLIKKLYRK